MIQNQVHDKFKVFCGSLGPDRDFSPLAKQVSDFVGEKKVAAKSIGVEFLESSQQLVVTLGYRDDHEHYDVTLTAVSLGSSQVFEPGCDFGDLEARLSEASAKVSNIICHELFVTSENELVMIFMTLA